jgi:hypothetical protein
LDEGFDVLTRSRTDTDLSLGDRKVRVRLEVFVKFFNCDVQTGRELISENVRGKALGLCLIHEKDVVINTTCDHSVNNGKPSNIMLSAMLVHFAVKYGKIT